MQKQKKVRIYILPTRFGLVFIIGAMVMILIGSAYQNNLVNMLAFFMLSLVFVCMIQTQNNLKDVIIHDLETEGGFQGKEFLVTTILANKARTPRYNLETLARRHKALAVYENHQVLPDRGTLKLRTTYPATKRGVFKISEARISTVYPLGLFESWTWFKNLDSSYFIYPELKGEAPFPGGDQEGGTALFSRQLGGEDFHGHRKFANGDSYRHVDWKARARGRPMLIKEFTEGEPGAAILDWHSLGGLDLEARLSQLAKWVDEAKGKKILFSLRLPNEVIPPGQGLLHAKRCWQSLASFSEDHEPKRKM